MFGRRSIVLSITVISILLAGCGGLHVEKLYRDGIIASSSPIATEIGLDVLKNGGNAFDAAVAVGFALAVAYPEAGNIGGGGFALVFNSGDDSVSALDFREAAPSASDRDMYLDSDKNIIPKSSTLGARAAGIPGTVAGLFELWSKHGSLEWFSLLEPAIHLADNGFILSDFRANKISEYRQQLSIFEETKKIFFPGGRELKATERFIQKDLSLTLERIGRDSLAGFYSGETAELILECMKNNNGLITLEDLANYKVKWRRPVQVTFDSLDIYSMPPPSSGGVILGQILKLIEPYDFNNFNPQSADYIHLFTEACRLAYADRAVHLGDPDQYENPVEQLLKNSYVDSRRNLIDMERAGNSEQVVSGLSENQPIPESESTTHYCIADKWGNVVSITYTINASFGSKLIVGGAGFLLNNEMDDFSIKPGVPNIYGLIGGQANEIAPNKRMLSSMSPTIVLKRGKPAFALGAPGGSKIITTVAQAIIGYSRFGLTPNSIVEQPRFHHQWLPDTLYLELGEYDINTIQDLISRGHIVKERDRYSDLQIINFSDNQFMTGASDPRNEGLTSGY